MSPDQTAQKSVGFLDLPTEVRHKVYKDLFCHRALPIPLGSGSLAPLQLQHKIDLDEPVFHTALFRVNKDISTDAIRFAYSVNSFQLPSDLTSFCRLGSTALASIRSLTVYNNCWLAGRESQAVWDIINHRCSSLELLVVQPSTHLLWQAIPQLKKYVAEFDWAKASRPRLVFHLYVFDRHFSFDLPEREYQRALQELKGAEGDHDGWYGFLKPGEMVSLLPRHVKQINCVLDVSAGGIHALDEVIRDSSDLPLIKMTLPASTKTFRHGSRDQLCYVWGERNEV
ncbi:hypothetical protein PV08_11674 [Exophiala spinifera]|uniref:Uncharacterized protein n=1 Tax=Exophiala spinifera TaxID=91928 RepID=A0A0D2AW55_9EURO|nr:uncharacterized protein PV08_11827 [Exophiala spinifera]XP_016230926.1 uncharacterized protein PV08_11674 [Exophiala spinifera]KIW10051.1 hypothetical protein PV08_11827 [Exophiala spinifera]KIW10710.1 hypothetical protein PV08_11674 [Exophiala spinifera]